jgi:hypothetical protein
MVPIEAPFITDADTLERLTSRTNIEEKQASLHQHHDA